MMMTIMGFNHLLQAFSLCFARCSLPPHRLQGQTLSRAGVTH
jgi:hypothetical protein